MIIDSSAPSILSKPTLVSCRHQVDVSGSLCATFASQIFIGVFYKSTSLQRHLRTMRFVFVVTEDAECGSMSSYNRNKQKGKSFKGN